MALTGAILSGLGVSVGAIVPMVFKGSGLFKGAADLGSPAGLAVLCGVAVMLVGVLLASFAGFGRDRELKKSEATSGGFMGGLIMTVIAGVLSTGTAFAFVYSQDPIIANLSMVRSAGAITVAVEGNDVVSGRYEVRPDGTIDLPDVGPVTVAGLNARHASERIQEKLAAGGTVSQPAVRIDTGSIAVTFAVFAVSLFGGALVNVGYAAYVLTRKKSWNVFSQSWKEIGLAVVIGINFSLAVTLMGKGMLLLGALGASVGWGIQQAMQMTGTQIVGFISGEWRGVAGKPRHQMYLAIAVLIVAASIMAYGNTLARGDGSESTVPLGVYCVHERSLDRQPEGCRQTDGIVRMPGRKHRAHSAARRAGSRAVRPRQRRELLLDPSRPGLHRDGPCVLRRRRVAELRRRPNMARARGGRLFSELPRHG